MSVSRAGGGAGTVAVSTRDVAGGGAGATGCAACGVGGTGPRTICLGRGDFSRGGTGVGGGERNVTSVGARLSSRCERSVDETEVIETSAVRKSAIVTRPDAASSPQGGELRRGSNARLSRSAVRTPYGGRGIRTPKSLRTPVFKFADTICAHFNDVAFCSVKITGQATRLHVFRPHCVLFRSRWPIRWPVSRRGATAFCAPFELLYGDT
jgi:hypothetical protein